MGRRALIFATLETKGGQAAYLAERLALRQMRSDVVDISLRAGRMLDAAGKRTAMDETVERVGRALDAAPFPAGRIAVGLGGGTGSEMILRLFRRLPADAGRLLVAPLSFDLRAPLADCPMPVLLSAVDPVGLNPQLRGILDQAAAVATALCAAPPPAAALRPVVAVSSLGVTGPAVDWLAAALAAEGLEVAAFHANGFGGAALVRHLRHDAPLALADLTTHELVRALLGGPRTPMPERFAVAGSLGLPQAVLPGGLNFLGFDSPETVPPAFRGRPGYRHSGFFTHVQLQAPEMERVASELCRQLRGARGPCSLIVPMGGFSSQDRPGGEIESPDLRRVFLATVRQHLPSQVELAETPAHVNDPETTELILARLRPVIAEARRNANATSA